MKTFAVNLYEVCMKTCLVKGQQSIMGMIKWWMLWTCQAEQGHASYFKMEELICIPNRVWLLLSFQDPLGTQGMENIIHQEKITCDLTQNYRGLVPFPLISSPNQHWKSTVSAQTLAILWKWSGKGEGDWLCCVDWLHLSCSLCCCLSAPRTIKNVSNSSSFKQQSKNISSPCCHNTPVSSLIGLWRRSIHQQCQEGIPKHNNLIFILFCISLFSGIGKDYVCGKASAWEKGQIYASFPLLWNVRHATPEWHAIQWSEFI